MSNTTSVATLTPEPVVRLEHYFQEPYNLAIATARTCYSSKVISPDDVVQTAKCIMEFAKANEEKLVIRGGWIEGQLLDRKHVEELASLPSRPQLIARVVCAIESPLADLIVTLERLIGDVAWIVEEASKTVKPVEPVQTGQPANGQTGQQNPTEHTGGETNHA